MIIRVHENGAIEERPDGKIASTNITNQITRKVNAIAPNIPLGQPDEPGHVGDSTLPPPEEPFQVLTTIDGETWVPGWVRAKSAT